MAHAPDTAHGTPGTPDLAERRRGWQTFLKSAKWFALLVLAVVFSIIFVQVGHAPLIPTVVLMAVVTYILGSLFH